MGGITAEHAASAHGDVDAVIISGIAPDPPEHEQEDGAQDTEGGAPEQDAPEREEIELYPFYPAEQDPKFAEKGLPAGYLTTQPDTRAGIFLHEGTYDPAVLAYEESLKDTLAMAEIRAVRSGSNGAEPERNLDVPVLYVLGRHDAIACAAAAGDCEIAPSARGADYIVPDSGHSINVSNGAPLFYERTFRWLAELGITH